MVTGKLGTDGLAIRPAGRGTGIVRPWCCIVSVRDATGSVGVLAFWCVNTAHRAVAPDFRWAVRSGLSGERDLLTTTSWNVIDKSLGSLSGNNNEFIAMMMTKDEIAGGRSAAVGVAGGI